MADLRLFGRRSFAATGFVAFAISATVIGMIIYLSLYVQNTLGYSPVQAGLRFLPLSLVSFAVALLTGRLIGKVAMRVRLCVVSAAPAAGLASMAHLTATSTWLVLVPGLILAGIGLGITSTGLASAALSAVEPAHAGMAAGLVNTLRQSAPPPAWPCSAPSTPPASPPPPCTPWPACPRRHRQRPQRRPARRGRLRRARRHSWIRVRTRPGQAAAAQPRPGRTVRPAGPRPAPGPAGRRARNSATRTSSRRRRGLVGGSSLRRRYS
jgi:Major Facilitator Superfamily